MLHLRIVVLLLLAAATVAGADWAYHFAVVSQIDLVLGAATLTIAALAAFAALRHPGLAILTALVPLAGLAAVAGQGVRSLFAIYAVGFVVALLVADSVVTGVLANGDRRAGALSALRACGAAFLAASVGAVLASWRGSANPTLTLGAAMLWVSQLLFAFLAVPLAASLLPFGEDFLARASRVREARERLLRITTAVCAPRWAMSVTGIAVVLGTLSWFEGHEPAHHVAAVGSPLLWTVSAAVAAVLALAVGRDWREAIATVPALAVLMLVALWLWRRLAGPLSTAEIPWLVAVALAAFLPMQIATSLARLFRAEGDDAPTARMRALERLGLTPLLATGGAALASLPWIVLQRGTGVFCVLLVLAGCAAVLAYPAIATALEQIVPRRKTVDEIYGRR